MDFSTKAKRLLKMAALALIGISSSVYGACHIDGTSYRVNGDTDGAYVSLDNLKSWSEGDDVTTCDVSNIRNLHAAFSDAVNFNQDISAWNVSNATNMSYMFRGASTFNQDISAWDVSNVTNMSFMFRNASAFNQPLNNWDVSKVTSMQDMFSGAKVFNQPLDQWKIDSLTSVNRMFDNARAFNQPIFTLGVNNQIASLVSMFRNAKTFNQSINHWDVSNVTNMTSMFTGASVFNQPLDQWSVNKVTNMGHMFSGAASFNQAIFKLEQPNVTNMGTMFFNAARFNQDISNWQVDNVSSMTSMFNGATQFNQDVSAWNVGNVTDMSHMFHNASNFNQDISAWNVSNVTNMESMFNSAGRFNQSIGSWNVSKVESMSAMFASVSLSTENYDKLLMSWSALDLQPNVEFDAGHSKYSSFDEAVNASKSILKSKNWSIKDGGGTLEAQIASVGVEKGKISNLSPIALTFNISEAVTDFDALDVYVTGGTLSNFSGSGKAYTATVTPKAPGVVSINIPRGGFHNTAGDVNLRSEPFYWTYDPRPDVLITSDDVSDGGVSNSKSISITVQISEEIVGFTANMVEVNKDYVTIESVNGSGHTYIVTLVSKQDGLIEVDVPADVFLDTGGNGNNAAKRFSWTYDSIPPGVEITANGVLSGTTSNDAHLTLTFKTSEEVYEFTANSVIAIGADIEDFSGTGDTYTATLVPHSSGQVSVYVPANGFIDLAGNDGRASKYFYWTYDHTLPTLISTMPADDAIDVAVNSNLVLNFSEPVFAGEGGLQIKQQDDHGAWVSINASDTTQVSGLGTSTIVIDPETDLVDGTQYYLIIDPNAFYELAGNYYVGISDATTLSFATKSNDVLPPSVSIMANEVNDGETFDHHDLSLTFKLSEDSDDFDQSDVEVSGGQLEAFSGTGSTYTATLVPNGQGLVGVNIAANSFSDAAGNYNVEAAQFSWTYLADPTNKADVVDLSKSWQSAASRWPMVSMDAVSQRLDWLERNQGSEYTSHQGIQLRFNHQALDQLINLKPRDKDAVATEIKALNLVQKAQSWLDSDDTGRIVMEDIKSEIQDLVVNEAARLRAQIVSNLNPSSKPLLGDWSLWSAGEITLGKDKDYPATQDFRLESLSIGIDKPLSSGELSGVVLSAGQGKADIGTLGSQLDADHYALSAYRVFTPQDLKVEAMAGVGYSRFNSIRQDQEDRLMGRRGAHQWFGSAALSKQALVRDHWQVSPYAKASLVRTKLSAFSEHGGATALSYDQQRLDESRLHVGADSSYLTRIGDAQIKPFVNIEYSTDVSSGSNASMRYNLGNKDYTLALDRYATDRWKLDVGMDLSTQGGWESSLIYQRRQQVNTGYSNSLGFNVELKF